MPIKTNEKIKKLLNSPSDHKKPIEEEAELDDKRRWYEQFFPNSAARNKEASKNNKVDNVVENEHSEPNSSNTELNVSGAASLSNSSTNSTMSLEAQHKESDILVQNLTKHSGIPKLIGSVSSLSNSTEKSSVGSNNQKSATQKNVASFFSSTPNFGAVDPKVDSHNHRKMQRRMRNFIKENINAVSKKTVKYTQLYQSLS